jgi:uncharacterized protein YejL (UPF0352 family)
MIDKDKLISESLDFSFLNSDIKKLSYFKDPKLSEGHVLLEIKDDQIFVLNSHKSIDELRLNTFGNFLINIINGLNINCRFILNTRDENSSMGFSTFQFSKKENNSHHITVLDPHYILRYINYKPSDQKQFKDKKNKIVFRGTDTGCYPNPLKNERIQLSKETFKKSWADIKISKFLFYDKESLSSFEIEQDKIKGDFLDFAQQSENKFIADIYGHTVAWDRNIWAMGLNSILLKLHLFEKDKIHVWYSKFLDDHHIVPNLFLKDLEDFVTLTPENKLLEILEKQLNFSKVINDQNTHKEYMKKVLIKYNEAYNG